MQKLRSAAVDAPCIVFYKSDTGGKDVWEGQDSGTSTNSTCVNVPLK